MTYSIDFRKRVLEVKEKERLSIAETAKRFLIGTSTIVSWMKRIEACNSRNKPATKVDRQALARDVREYPDAFQHERATRLGVSQPGIFHALKRMGISYKKNSTSPKGATRVTAYLPREHQESS